MSKLRTSPLIEPANKFLIDCVNRGTIHQIKETSEALNDGLDDNEEVYSNESKE